MIGLHPLRPLLVLGSFTLACSAQENWNAGVDADWVYVLGRSGSSLEVLAQGVKPPHRFETEFEELIAVGVDAADLEPIYGPLTAPPELAVAAPPEHPRRTQVGLEAFLTSALPSATKIVTIQDGLVTTGPDSMRTRLALVASIDPESCRPNWVGPERIGPPLEAAFPDLAAGGQGRVIVTSLNRLDLIHMDSQSVSSVIPPEPSAFHGSILDRSNRIWTVGCYRNPLGEHDCDPARGGILFETPIANESLGQSQTATTTLTALSLIALDTQGRTLLMMGRGGAYTFDLETRVTTRLPDVPGLDPSSRPAAITAVPSEEYPFVTSVGDGLLLFSAATQSLEYRALEGGVKSYGLTTITAEGSVEVWFGGTNGILGRMIDFGTPEIVKPIYPPRLSACLMGNQTPLRDIVDLIATEDRVVVLLEKCTAAVVVRPSDLCSSLLETREAAEFDYEPDWAGGVYGPGDGLFLQADEVYGYRVP